MRPTGTPPSRFLDLDRAIRSGMRLLGGPLLVGGLLMGCGGSIEPDTTKASPDAPPSVAEPNPPSVAEPNPPRVTAPNPPAESMSPVEYFHRGAANLAIDHQRSLFAIHQHLPTTDHFYGTCGSYAPQAQAFGEGTRLELSGGVFYPSSFGGGISVTEVRVAKLDSDGLVLHVSMTNGEQFDDRWSRGLGTECEGDCVPNSDACATRAD